jgi:hypothetical protein
VTLGDSARSTGHSFDDDDTDHLRELTSAMRFVGGGGIALAALIFGFIAFFAMRFTTTYVMPFAVMFGLDGACLLTIGLLHWRVTRSLAQIYESEGDAIPHVMEAMKRMRGLYRFLAVLLCIFLVVGVILPAIGAIAAIVTTSASHRVH